MLASMSANTHTPASPDGQRARPFLLLLVHVVVGVLLMAGLFQTVHRRDVRSPAFESRWVKTGVFDQRWINLVETWKREGYWNHGGLWKMNTEPWFVASLKGSQWFQTEAYNPDEPCYYRSNSALFVAPLACADLLVGRIVPIRWTSVIVNQGLVLVAAVLIGLLTTRLARACGADLLGSLVLGVCAQAVYQTHPLNLASYFGLYMQHAFAIPCVAFMLAMTFEEECFGRSRVLRAAAVLGMVLADLPHAMCTLVAWAFVSMLIDRRRLSRHACAWTIIPALVGGLVIASQWMIAKWHHPGAVWAGSGLLFRTGLDGDTQYFTSALHGYARLFTGPVLYGKGDAGREPIFWGAMLLAPPLTALVAIWWRRLRITIVPLVVAFGGIVFFNAVFANAFAIHPYAYGVLLLVPGIPAAFAPIAGGLEAQGGQSRLVPLLATCAAVVIVFSQLREFAIQFPIAPDRTTLPAK
jgi:hypothetical protein